MSMTDLTGTCPCLDTITGGASGEELLLLAPLDADADAALSYALQSGGFGFERRGPALALSTSRSELLGLGEAITNLMPHHLQVRVKGVYASAVDSPQSLLTAFLHSESLPLFLQQAEVGWARDALRDNWLFSVFHPIVDAHSGARFAYEALIRARHPETKETISAWQLIHACSRLNLQHQLDQQARVSAIRAAAALDDPNGRFFINFLPGAVFDPAVSLRTTMEVAEEHHVDLARLVFEVVETEEIEDVDRLRGVLDYYRHRGAGIALDDVGSGFSSLHYLSELRPDYVKIDRHICVAAAESASARHTLDSIVGLARKLGARVVAEGVETMAQMHTCVEAGADYLQGFLFAHPANPPEEVPSSLFRTLRCAA